MVNLVPRRDPADDFDCVLGRRLGYVNGGEPARESCVPFDVLSVLDVCGGPDAGKLAASERCLELVCQVVRRVSAGEQRMNLVDEQDDFAFGALHLKLESSHSFGQRAANASARDEPTGR